MSSKSRLVPILFVISILLLTACKSIKDTIIPRQPKLDKAFSCSFDLTAFADDRDSKMCVSGDMTRYGTGIWEMNITAPETVKGLNIRYNEGTTAVSLGSLTLDIDSSKLNDTAMFKRIFDAFDSCAAMHDIELYEKDGAVVYNGTDHSITFDKETLLPTAVEFSDGITVGISSFCDLAEQVEQSEQSEQSETSAQ